MTTVIKLNSNKQIISKKKENKKKINCNINLILKKIVKL